MTPEKITSIQTSIQTAIGLLDHISADLPAQILREPLESLRRRWWILEYKRFRLLHPDRPARESAQQVVKMMEEEGIIPLNSYTIQEWNRRFWTPEGISSDKKRGSVPLSKQSTHS